MKVLDRRQFFRQAGVAAMWAGSAALLEQCEKDEVAPKASANFTLDLSSPANSALQTVGGAVVKNGVIVIRKSASEYVALSTVCTHEGCTINYSSSSNRLVCPCHGSIFSNTGQVIQGPASSALPQYTVSVSGNILTVTS